VAEQLLSDTRVQCRWVSHTESVKCRSTGRGPGLVWAQPWSSIHVVLNGVLRDVVNCVDMMVYDRSGKQECFRHLYLLSGSWACSLSHWWTVETRGCHLMTAFVMAALWNRAGHYIFAMWFLSSSSSSSFFLSFFFPCLISAIGDWMSTILPHMVWP